MLVGYLHTEGFVATSQVLQDEAKVKVSIAKQRQSDLKHMRKHILGIESNFFLKW